MFKSFREILSVSCMSNDPLWSICTGIRGGKILCLHVTDRSLLHILFNVIVQIFQRLVSSLSSLLLIITRPRKPISIL